MAAEPDTVVGVATGRPDGGVAIVRVSGPRAFEVAEALVGSLPRERELAVRRLSLPTGTEPALVVSMRGPRSYTGEDVVELHVHAGSRNVGEVVEAVVAGGARAASAGEFTRRAFEGGRLGLDQAEGIAAVIAAQTEGALRQARRLIAGELGRSADALRERVRGLQVEVEANLDFPEDVDAGARARWASEVGEQRATLGRWLSGFEAGRRGRERARIVLAGPANAGKSSLFNGLVGRPRALVAHTPGTTRDYVEGEVEVEGYAGVLVDTAGLRSTEDGVERAGVALAEEQIAGADLILWIEGADAEPAAVPGAIADAGVPVVRVENKRDLGVRRSTWVGAVGVTQGRCDVSALRDAIGEWFRAGAEQAWIGLARHRDRVAEADEALGRAGTLLGKDTHALELVAFELGIAAGRLGEITGRHALGATGAEVLDAIFSRFCIGK